MAPSGPVAAPPPPPPHPPPPGSTSLVPIRESFATGPAPICPRKADLIALDRVTGQVVPLSCGANFCAPCQVRKAGRIGRAMVGAKPERFGTLTQLGPDWQTCRMRLGRLAHQIRKRQPGWRWVWYVEPNPKGTGNHCHFWQRGKYLHQATLSRLADREGLGFVTDIRWWEPSGAEVTYGVKLLGVGYGLKDVTASSSAAETYLRANGGRLVHSSRGWWLNRAGEPCRQAQALMEWSQDPDDCEHDWVVVRRDQLDRALSTRPGAELT